MQHRITPANTSRALVELIASCSLILLNVGGCGSSLFPSGMTDLVVEFNVGGSQASVSVPESPVFTEEPIFESIPGMAGHHAGTITVLPDGELLAAWYSYSGPHELTGSAIYMARRPAGSGTWGTPELHVDRSQGDGNPVLYSEGDHVWLFQAVVPFGWDASHIEFQESFDRGETWTTPQILGSGIGGNVKYPPVRLADGTLLLPAYDELLHRSVFYASTNGGPWVLRSSVASDPGNLQPSFVQISTGQLLCTMRNHEKGWLWVMVSNDNGITWSTPADSGFPNPASAAHLIRLRNGHLMLIYNDSTTERRPLTAALSADEGRTWPHKMILKNGTDTYSYPFAVQAPDGLIHIVYSHNRDRIQHITINEAWVAAAK